MDSDRTSLSSTVIGDLGVLRGVVLVVTEDELEVEMEVVVKDMMRLAEAQEQSWSENMSW